MKILLENGANPEDENANGMTPLSLAAWNGHSCILGCFEKKYWRRCSKKALNSTIFNLLNIFF